MDAVLELPEIEDRHAFNLQRWEAISADPAYAGFEGRVESDRFGNPIMMPPPHFGHSRLQFQIARRIDLFLTGGITVTECPISTTQGVKAADVAWISVARQQRALASGVLLVAPEICVEVLSPSNTRTEMIEKKAFYFEAGAREVWFCDSNCRMFFFLAEAPEQAQEKSNMCPDFPLQADAPGA